MLNTHWHSGWQLPAGSAQRLPFAIVVALLLLLQFGPMVGLLGYRLTQDPEWAISGASRDVLVAVLVALAALVRLGGGTRPAPLPASARWALVMVAAYGGLSLLSSTDPFALAYNLRRLMLVPLLYVALLTVPWQPLQVDRLFAVVVTSTMVVALFGLFERLSPDSLWTEFLDIESFTAANGFDRFGRQGFFESGRFFSWDLEAWAGGPLRRMLSTYLEPTTLAAGLSAALVVLLARQARGHASGAAIVLVALCGLLTLSKSFAIFLVLLAAWRVLGVPSPRHVSLIVVAALAVSLALTGRGLVDGPFEHVAGVDSALRYLLEGNLIGEGVGQAGNYAHVDNDIGAESGLGNGIVQVGLAALLPLLWLRAIAVEVLQAAEARGDPGGPWIASWVLFWVVAYVFSASSQGVGGNALGFAVLALYLSRTAYRSAS